MADVTTKLKPCPFCGCKKLRVRILSRTTHVACTKCAAEGPYIDIDWSEDEGADVAVTKAKRLWEQRQ